MTIVSVLLGRAKEARVLLHLSPEVHWPETRDGFLDDLRTTTAPNISNNDICQALCWMFYVNASAGSSSITFSYAVFLAIPEAWGWFSVSEENLGSEPVGKCPAPPGIEQREDFRPNLSMPDRAHLSRVHHCSEWEKKGKDPKVWEAGAPYRALGGQALHRPASVFPGSPTLRTWCPRSYCV